MVASRLTLENHLESVILQKYQWFSNPGFKNDSTNLSSLYLTAVLSFERRFRMFIINDYFAKVKRQTICKLLGGKQKIDKFLCLK